MFGFGKKAPEFRPFSEEKPHTFNTLLCDGVTAFGLRNLDDVLFHVRRLQAEHPGVRVLTTLDDPQQAAYTSGHTVDAHRLDDLEGHDLAALSPECFEAGEHIGYFTTPEEFPFRLANLQKAAQGTAFGDFGGLIDWDTGEDDVLRNNRRPDEALGLNPKERMLIQCVPVLQAADALAAYPNGYFTSDLNPIQNYALCRHLEARYGLMLFGVGARFLGFYRNTPLEADAASALASDLSQLYAGAPADAVTQLAALFTGRDWLLVRYAES